MRNNKFLMLAVIALPMFVGCKDDSKDNTDNKSEENVTAVTGITLSASSLSLAVGDTSALTFTISPSNATNKNVTWSSSNTNVASVANGVVRAVAVGIATISVKTADGNKTDTCAVNVVAQGQAVAVTGITISPTSLSLIVGGTDTLTAVIAPANAANKAVAWTTSNADVASVSAAGVVTAVAAGHATITVTTVDGVKTAICVVTVREQRVESVSISPAALSLLVGGTSTLTVAVAVAVAPENATNKAVTWSVSPAGVITVSDTGLVTAVAAGNATIMVTTADGNMTATCMVRAIVPPNEIVVVSSSYGTDTIKLRNVEGGTFVMGCSGSRDGDNTGECYDDEKPAHNVTLSSYKIGQFEVTQKLWRVVMGRFPGNASSAYGLGDNYPLYNVSWNDIQTFLTTLNQMTGKQFRLPTEAEWEYAARGGNQSRGYKYSGSNNVDEVAWYNSNSGNKTHIVGTKSPNELGIYDMSGNVDEWCSDWYGSYSSDAQVNPQGAVSGSYRVFRGSTWQSYARGCRAAFRDYFFPEGIGNTLGFRIVLSGE
jgi:uncharacterized protein YjdB